MYSLIHSHSSWHSSNTNQVLRWWEFQRLEQFAGQSSWELVVSLRLQTFVAKLVDRYDHVYCWSWMESHCRVVVRWIHFARHLAKYGRVPLFEQRNSNVGWVGKLVDEMQSFSSVMIRGQFGSISKDERVARMCIEWVVLPSSSMMEPRVASSTHAKSGEEGQYGRACTSHRQPYSFAAKWRQSFNTASNS